MDLIRHHFPNLSERQLQQFEALGMLYQDWNEKINVVSRKDIGNLYTNHVLHSLAIGKAITFKSYTHILDVGTGGGFPGIPLAILFPDAEFHLIDSIGKKIKVVQEVQKALGLTNVVAQQTRVQQLMEKKYDFMLSRGVTKLDTLYDWAKRLVVRENYNQWSNGLIVLKGGDLTTEIAGIKRKVKQIPIYSLFEQPYFLEKYVLHIKV